MAGELSCAKPMRNPVLLHRDMGITATVLEQLGPLDQAEAEAAVSLAQVSTDNVRLLNGVEGLKNARDAAQAKLELVRAQHEDLLLAVSKARAQLADLKSRVGHCKEPNNPCLGGGFLYGG